MTGLVVLLVALATALALAVLHRWYDGRLRRRTSTRDLRPLLPAAAGERATLLQFSSAFCAPCRATHRVLHDVAELVPGVRHVDVDAEAHLELVRTLDILKTPTTLVLDAQGREVLRATGRPSKHAVLAALGQAVPS
ncbi:MAG TPA: thioredoxin family protein [Mycobacteriales bacterium]|nr:thioredoxin family protein [Mycobacteriales bacterium]